ncbi:transposase InsO family protein [Bradyrhizobium ottawaense]
MPIGQGFLYLVAIIDWASRAVLAWRLSKTMDTSFCVSALEEALARFGRPEIFNTDQGSPIHQRRLHRHAGRHRRQDLDGRSRALDGQRVHRAAVALAPIRGHGHEAKAGNARWIEFYNFQRPHQALETARRWRSGGPVSPAHSGNKLWI